MLESCFIRYRYQTFHRFHRIKFICLGFGKIRLVGHGVTCFSTGIMYQRYVIHFCDLFKNLDDLIPGRGKLDL